MCTSLNGRCIKVPTFTQRSWGWGGGGVVLSQTRLCFGSPVQPLESPSAQCHNLRGNLFLFFFNGQHARGCHPGLDINSLKHVGTKHFQQPAVGLKNNLHEAISQTPHFLHPVAEEDSVQWGFDSPGCQMDLERKPWLLCDWHLLPVNHAWNSCDLRDGCCGSFPGYVWLEHHTPLNTRSSRLVGFIQLHLFWNPYSSEMDKAQLRFSNFILYSVFLLDIRISLNIVLKSYVNNHVHPECRIPVAVLMNMVVMFHLPWIHLT